MLLFRSEEHIARWLTAWRLPRGESFFLDQCWLLEQAWYGLDRREPIWWRKTGEEAEAVFAELELMSAFWRLRWDRVSAFTEKKSTCRRRARRVKGQVLKVAATNGTNRSAECASVRLLRQKKSSLQTEVCGEQSSLSVGQQQPYTAILRLEWVPVKDFLGQSHLNLGAP